MAAKSLFWHLKAALPPFKFAPVSPWDKTTGRYMPTPWSVMPKKWRSCRKVRMEIACRKHRFKYGGADASFGFVARFEDRYPPFDCDESRKTLAEWILIKLGGI